MAKTVKKKFQYPSDTFSKAHEGAGQLYGLAWLAANIRATEQLDKLGIDTWDDLVKTVCSVALRAAFDSLLKRDALNKAALGLLPDDNAEAAAHAKDN